MHSETNVVSKDIKWLTCYVRFKNLPNQPCYSPGWINVNVYPEVLPFVSDVPEMQRNIIVEEDGTIIRCESVR